MKCAFFYDRAQGAGRSGREVRPAVEAAPSICRQRTPRNVGATTNARVLASIGHGSASAMMQLRRI